MKTKTKKQKVVLIFGGKSAEHDVSVVSAKNIFQAMDKKKYEVSLLGIDKKGNWFYFTEKEFLSADNPFDKKNKADLVKPCEILDEKFDAVFPVLHGPYGEDGAMQGFLKILNIPFVGPSVLGSAIGMDKDVSKRLLRDAGIPSAKFLVYKKYQIKEINFEKIKKDLGLPFFIKPANLGSSVGISKVKTKKEFKQAIKIAFDYDNKIIIEEYIKGREIECSVLGNENPMVSIPGEIIPNHDFYSYNAKYLDDNGAILSIPAKLNKSLIKKIQKLAAKVFEIFCCEGMGRVDFFVTSKDKIYVNEINTIPGFTSISMYPKLWEFSGVSSQKLIDVLIKSAIDRHKKEEILKTT